MSNLINPFVPTLDSMLTKKFNESKQFDNGNHVARISNETVALQMKEALQFDNSFIDKSTGEVLYCQITSKKFLNPDGTERTSYSLWFNHYVPNSTKETTQVETVETKVKAKAQELVTVSEDSDSDDAPF